MLNLRGIRAPLLIGVASLGFGCEHDLTLSPPVDPSAAVVAQFDPTNPIPVLQLVPSPTALAERMGGGLNVTVQPCEIPSRKECLSLVTGWPTTTPITLFFSGDLEASTIPEGIKLYEVSGTSLTPVAYAHETQARTLPNEACAEGGNGSAGGYNPDTAIPPGNEVILTPNTPLKPGTKYRLYVESYVEGGVVKGLRSKDEEGKPGSGKRVEPSSLFALLNTPASSPPVSVVDGKGVINSALLRANVSSLVLAALFPNKTLVDLTAEERVTLETAIALRTSTGLVPLYGFFADNLAAGEAAGVTKRENLILSNSWTTAGAAAAPEGGEVIFDPARGRVPFPNAQLLTANSTSTVQVTIAVNPCGATPTPGCDSPSSAALKGGLNTLDGFSTTAPMTVQFSGNIDETSLAGNVFVHAVGPDGMAGAAVDVRFETKTSSGTSPAELRIIPVRPLDQNATYVVTLKRGIKGTDGKNFRRPQTFNFLAVREPLLTEDGEVNPEALVSLAPGAPAIPVRLPLQCSPVSAGLPFPSAEEVAASAGTIENLLRRARWAEALDTVATVTPAIAEDDVLIAWTHKTQSITRTVDLVQRALLPQAYQAVRTASGTPAIFGPLAEALTPQQIQGTILLTLCRSGQLAQAGIPPDMCTVNGQPNPALFTNPLVQALLPLFTQGIGSMRLYLMANYIATRGNPYVAGTFTPAAIRTPNVIQTPIWVITGTSATDAAKSPVIVFQHGLGSLKEAGFFIAGSFARTRTANAPFGYATVLMDLPYHGSRASDIVNNQTGVPCTNVQPEAVQCANGMCTGGCDGVQDSSGTGFLSANVFGARDNFRQGTIDQLTLIRLIETESQMGGALDYLDGARISYAGQSLGGITGGNLSAYASQLGASVLNVPGGGLVNILLGTVPQISAPLFAALAASGVCTPVLRGNAIVGCQDTAGFRQFLTIAQWALDPGDPLATSIGVRTSRPPVPALGVDKVLVQMVVPDLVVPNGPTRALGGAYGFDPTDNSETSHYQTYDYSGGAAQNCHGFLLVPTPGCQSVASATGSVCATFGAQQQAARFIATGGMTVGSRVPQGIPGCN